MNSFAGLVLLPHHRILALPPLVEQVAKAAVGVVGSGLGMRVAVLAPRQIERGVFAAFELVLDMGEVGERPAREMETLGLIGAERIDRRAVERLFDRLTCDARRRRI